MRARRPQADRPGMGPVRPGSGTSLNGDALLTTLILDSLSPTWGTWTRGGARRHPVSLAVSARPWIGSSNWRIGRVLHSHLRSPRLGAPYSSGGTFSWIAKFFYPPAERQSPGGAPRRRPRRIAGGWTRGSRPGSVASSRAVAAWAARARSRREGLHHFPYGFIVRYIVAQTRRSGRSARACPSTWMSKSGIRLHLEAEASGSVRSIHSREGRPFGRRTIWGKSNSWTVAGRWRHAIGSMPLRGTTCDETSPSHSVTAAVTDPHRHLSSQLP